MYVCLCKGVSDHTIRQAVDDGACSWRDVREQTGCATQCGKCACLGKTITRDALAQQGALARQPMVARQPHIATANLAYAV